MTSDRRRPPCRRKAALFVATSDGEPPVARSRDLSTTGIFLETENRVPMGSSLDISLAWGESLLSCQARVVRRDDAGIALAFVEPDTFFMQAIDEIMESSPPVEGEPQI
jgi:hypothetical protein